MRYVGGCSAKFSMAVGAGIGPDEGAAVGRQRGKEEEGYDSWTVSKQASKLVLGYERWNSKSRRPAN
jgi:hypothetical protein